MRFCRFKFLHEINYVEVGDVTDVIFMSSPSRDSVCSEVTANEDEPERHGKTACITPPLTELCPSSSLHWT